MQEYQQIGSIMTEAQNPNRNKIGLLGGTFNPIHNGHIRMASIALCEFLLGEVIFLPTGDPPHKQNSLIAPSRQRIDMIKLAIEDYPSFSVSAIETQRAGTTYTIDTLEALKRSNVKSEYYYIIGADTLFELHTWKNIDKVLSLTNFICILRPGTDDADAKEYAAVLNEKYHHNIYIANDKGPSISSSQIRSLAMRGELRPTLVPDKVASYIAQNRIYSGET
ncbi:MAG: nicotinate-nucleotide adenylyltransferase [Clostridia bacterium]|jgi:nicotinate-nucleotide adenylyltransferase|nr:nicotinate-nucleotide adenylyltransferase [Clostridia bacterium]MBT7122881.1 nicotinate-nucleotide adenylyltransferase [Clostridia bacterium]